MKSIRKMQIKTKLYIAFGMFAVLTVVLGGIGIYSLDFSAKEEQEIAEELQPRALANERLAKKATEAHLLLEEILAGDNGENIEEVWQNLNEAKWYADTILNGGKKGSFMILGLAKENLHADIANIKLALDALIEIGKVRYHRYQQVLRHKSLAGSRAGSLGDQKFEETYDDLMASARNIETLLQEQIASELDESKLHRARTISASLAIVATVVLLAVILAFVVGRTVSARIARISEEMKDLSDGRLETEISHTGDHDEIGVMARALQVFKEVVSGNVKIASRVRDASYTVESSTNEIAGGIGDLSTRTEHQASSLEETSASMEELSATVRQNAENAQEANQIAAMARDSAISGAEVALKAVEAIGRIDNSSRRVSEIVGLIQEIAFQTNLLALNASVEAARAGEAGRGFAVVANEVRALAQRAGQASKDIKELIQTSDREVKEGVELVGQAGNSLSTITDAVKKVADFVSEIAAASQEQASGIDQVSRAIMSMDDVTQQNAALVEETTAALASAQRQVSDLREAVSALTLGTSSMEDLEEIAAREEALAATEMQGEQLRKTVEAMAGKLEQIRDVGPHTASASDEQRTKRQLATNGNNALKLLPEDEVDPEWREF